MNHLVFYCRSGFEKECAAEIISHGFLPTHRQVSTQQQIASIKREKAMNVFYQARFLVLLICAISAGTCQSTVSATLKQLLIDRINAVSNKDTVALDKICTKNYQIISSTGEKSDLTGLKNALSKNGSPIKLCTILSYQPFIAEDESMAFALFEIEEDFVGENQKITKNSLIVTEIYKKEKGRWKTQLSHISQKICLFPN